MKMVRFILWSSRSISRPATNYFKLLFSGQLWTGLWMLFCHLESYFFKEISVGDFVRYLIHRWSSCPPDFQICLTLGILLRSKEWAHVPCQRKSQAHVNVLLLPSFRSLKQEPRSAGVSLLAAASTPLCVTLLGHSSIWISSAVSRSQEPILRFL